MSFYKIRQDGRFEFFVDASLLKSFSLCERYFYYQHVMNLRPKATYAVRSFPLVIGSWWSQVMESFYNALRDGKEITQGEIQDFTLRAWNACEVEQAIQGDPKSFAAFGDLAGALLMLTEYWKSQYQIDKAIWKIIGVEQGFGLRREVLVGETDKVVVYWIGKPDLVVFERDRLVPVDHKTVSRIDSKTIYRYKPSSQMAGYCYATQVLANEVGIKTQNVNRCVVNICSRSRPAEGKARFVRAYPTFSLDEIAAWRQDVVNKCERIAHCLQHNDWLWAETSCHSMYMRDCPFVLLDSTTPSAHETILQSFFQEGTPWSPYEID
jgi:hypothetical protein